MTNLKFSNDWFSRRLQILTGAFKNVFGCVSQNQVRQVTHFTVYYIANAKRQFELYRRYLYAVRRSCFIFISPSLNNSSEVHFSPNINFRVKVYGACVCRCAKRESLQTM